MSPQQLTTQIETIAEKYSVNHGRFIPTRHNRKDALKSALLEACEPLQREVEELNILKETQRIALKSANQLLGNQADENDKINNNLQLRIKELEKVIQTKLDHDSWDFPITCGAKTSLTKGKE